MLVQSKIGTVLFNSNIFYPVLTAKSKISTSVEFLQLLYLLACVPKSVGKVHLASPISQSICLNLWVKSKIGTSVEFLHILYPSAYMPKSVG